MSLEGRHLAQGTLVEAEVGATPTWTEIGHITQFNTPGFSRPDVDISTLKSQAREYMKGLADAGTVSLPMLFSATDDGQQAMWDARDGNDPIPFRITLPNAEETQITFDALVNDIRLEGQIDSAVTGTLELRVTGKPEIEFDTTS